MSSNKATEKFNSKKNRKIEIRENITTNPNQVPMMYRAQIGRCSLQYAGSEADRNQWVKEWVYPIPNQPNQREPRHQHLEEDLREASFHCVKVEFPYRVFSNCGQDSIQRPVLDVRGIPFIPGSGVKGLFRRACQERDRVENRPKNESLTNKYCGDKDNLKPGCLRFHGAYPIGNWANRVVDVVHPQQPRQLGVNGSNKPTSASTLISLYQPTLIFKFSRTDKSVNWQEVETLLYEALRQGVGGKTSTGYGLGGKPEGHSNLLPKYARQQSNQNVFHLNLKGKGISSLLLDQTKTPEFRPNLFKATLRGHFSRLLAGVCDCEPAVKATVNYFLGGPDRKDNDREGIIQLFWESPEPNYDWEKRPTSYETEGVLHIAANSKAQINDFNFVLEVLKFACIMGGFGKSWRRVWHETFYPDYFKQEKEKFHIGCHWESLTPNWVEFQHDKANKQLQDFLEQLYKNCCDRFGAHPPKSLTWREAWHPDRVLVYSQVVRESKLVRDLFHNEVFKTTPAIGGRRPGDERPTSVSSVWHRMLPLPDNQYLEIVTVFHGDRTPWKREEKDPLTGKIELKDQLPSFITAIKSALKITTPTWGNESKL